jgi:hypothetical protein
MSPPAVFHTTDETINNFQEKCGAPGRVRTRDPLITNQVLYQLSYKGLSACQVTDFDLL